MTWTDALKVGAVILTSLGGGGAIVLGFSRLLGDIWIQRLKGDINRRLKQLDAKLEHGNFVLRRLAEYELEAVTECWRAAKICEPTLNAVRPLDSSTDNEILRVKVRALVRRHNAVLRTIGKHEPFLASETAGILREVVQVVALELFQVMHHTPFDSKWFDEGTANQHRLQELVVRLERNVRGRIADLREASASVGRETTA